MKLKAVKFCAILLIIPLLFACTVPQMTVEARTFLNLSLDYLDQYELTQSEVKDPDFGGLSGLFYDRQTNEYQAIADAKQNPRFYRLAIQLDESDPGHPKFSSIAVLGKTFLTEPLNDFQEAVSLDPEGIVQAPNQKLYVTSEGLGLKNPPLIGVFDATTGDWQERLPSPLRYLSDQDGVEQTQGIYPNFGFESLAISPEGDRLFTATESPLVQDIHGDQSAPHAFVRFLHYWIGVGDPYLVAEHIYPLESPSFGMVFNGLSEMTSVDVGGHFLFLERSVSPQKDYSAQIFQGAIGEASDTVKIETIPDPLGAIVPIQKQSLFDLSTLDFPVSNLEGMTFGPTLKDGSRTLILLSDNGFNAQEPTQFLLFRLQQFRPQPT